jgi:CDP-paratose 2-epimerase
MKKKSILITGGAGFVGSNLAVFFKKKNPDWTVICLDNLKRRGSELNLKRFKKENIRFIHADIRNQEDLNFECNTDIIIDCAAEPSVLAGLEADPWYLINTNLVGTVNTLKIALKNKADVVFISTSRVYPYQKLNNLPVIEGDHRFHWTWSEKNRNMPVGWKPIGVGSDFRTDGPKSLYGASKLCSETIIHEYCAMYGLRAVINRCGLIAGPWQFGKVDQGVCMHWLLAHYFKLPLSYIGYGGTGKQVRDILHVNDLFSLIDLQIKDFDKANGQVYNIGGGEEFSLSLKEMSKLCQSICGGSIAIGHDRNTRPMDLKIYLSDNAKAKKDFNWHPSISPEELFLDMHKWIQANESQICNTLLIT